MYKKYFMSILAIMMVALLSLGFTSCGDDDELKGNASIAGNWVSGNETLQLGSSGSYYSYYGSNPTGSDSQYRKGTYSYNPSQNLLVINIAAVANHNGAYTQTYIVQTLTKTTLVLLYTDGDVKGYYTRK